MTTVTQRQFRINGVVDSNNTNWQNAEDIAGAAASWMTYDYSRNQVAVIINKPGLPVKHFNDDNIITAITVTETSIEGLFNAVQFTFPHVDLTDRKDSITVELPETEWLGSEVRNVLQLETDLFNNPVQAEQIALTELRQNRQSKVAAFSTDFTCMNVTAGDVVELSNDHYGWDRKLFRVVSVEEADDEQGSIVLSFILVEYSGSQYDYDDLRRVERTRKTGIPGSFVNTSIQTANSVAVARQVATAAGTPEGQAALSEGGIPTITVFTYGWSQTEVSNAVSGPSGGSFGLTLGPLPAAIKSAQILFNGPVGQFNYVVDGQSKSVFSGIPLQVTFEVQPEGGAYQVIETKIMEWSTYTTSAVLTDIPLNATLRILASPINTIDLNAADPVVTFVSGTNISVNATGDAASLVMNLST